MGWKILEKGDFLVNIQTHPLKGKTNSFKSLEATYNNPQCSNGVSKQQPVDKNLIELHLEASRTMDKIINKRNMGNYFYSENSQNHEFINDYFLFTTISTLLLF